MGRVFTWEEVQENRIPENDYFPLVAERVKKTLTEDRHVIAASLFGSVVRGTYNPRSDIDCFVFYEPKNERHVMGVLHDIHRYAETLYVPVNFVPCDTVVAETKMHLFGPLFQYHLDKMAREGGVIKGKVSGIFAESIPPHKEAEEYVRAKLYTLQEADTQLLRSDEEMYVRLLKKFLDAPVHVARKTLGAFGYSFDGSKKEVGKLYSSFASPELSNILEQVVFADTKYGEELEFQQQNPDKIRYKMFLHQHLEPLIPNVIVFVRGNALLLHANH